MNEYDKLRLLVGAAKTGSESTIRLIAQVVDVAPCPVCDYRKEFCRCPDKVQSEQS